MKTAKCFYRVWLLAERYKDEKGVQYALGITLLEDGITSRRPRMVPGVLALLAGVLLFFLVGGFSGEVSEEKRTSGKIEAIERGGCRADISYRTDGRIFQMSAAGGDFCSKRIGERVEIGYNELDPGEARVVGSGGWVFGVLAVAFLMAGLAIFAVRLGGVLLGFWLLLRGSPASSPLAEQARGEALRVLSPEEPRAPVFEPR